MAVNGGTSRRVVLLEDTPAYKVDGDSLGWDRIFLTVAEDQGDIRVMDMEWPGADKSAQRR